jgi:YesN/AraC family two-component response regulator
METMSERNHSISILLVEDEQDTLELFTNIITMKYPDVVLHSAINGRTGLELFKTHTPDIVMTDINMPEMNGVQLVDKIKAIKPDVMIIVLTAGTGKTILENPIGEGFEIDHLIVKPVVFGELFAAIEQCIAEITRQN